MPKSYEKFDPSIIDDDAEDTIYSNNDYKTDNVRSNNSGNEEKNREVQETEANDEESMGFWTSVINFFKDKRLHRTIGLILFLVSAYVLITSIHSFLGAGEEDVSEISKETIKELSKHPDTVKNIGGATGATISHILINNSLGLGAFFVIAYFLIISYALLFNKKIKFWELTFKTLLFTVTTSIVMATFMYYTPQSFLYGGQHGRMVVMALDSYAGYISALGLSIFLICVIIIIYYNKICTTFIAIAALFRKVFNIKEKEDVAQIQENESTEVIPESALDNQPEENIAPIPVEEEPVVEIVIDETPETLGKNVPGEEHIDTKEDNKKPENIDLKINVTEIESAEGKDPEKPYDPTAELSRYQFPTLDLLKEYDTSKIQVDKEEQEENKQRISMALAQYGISIQNIEATVGPTITLYEIIPAEGIRIQQIKNLENDLMLNLKAIGIRIIAPMPGRGTIGIEVPNKDPQIVSIRSILGSKAYRDFKGELPMAIGATISNDVYIADLAKMPHLLVAGATGQGKSVGMNTIIASLLYKKHPATLKFVLIDPKFVEFSLYSKLEKHYLAKLPEEEESIITKPDRAVATLNSLCLEMDNRYSLLRDASCRTIKEYNEKFTAHRLNPEKGHRYLPYIVVIVDEFADIIATAGKDIELPISRITAKARAVGIHMILSTQRPSTNVITGTIKANVPSRIAFKVSQMIDSRTIIDAAGAQHLIGRGDMLFLNAGSVERVQCALIETGEVEAICNHIDHQLGYDHAYYLPDYNPNESASGGGGGNAGAINDRDELFEDAARTAALAGSVSASSLQRRFKIGYNRAASLVEQFEAMGIVGPQQGVKPRQVLMDLETLERFLESL